MNELLTPLIQNAPPPSSVQTTDSRNVYSWH